jgi:hypothetical protein
VISRPRSTPRRIDPGVVWASTGGSSGTDLGDIFGHRTFAFHASQVDFHRGIDTLDGLANQPVYTSVCGKIIRKNYSMFNWRSLNQFNQFTEINPAVADYALFGGDRLQITGFNNGAPASFPADISRFECNQLFNVGNQTTEDWSIQFKLRSLPAGLAGQPCFGIYQAANNEYAIIGENVSSQWVTYGRDSGGLFINDGDTFSVSGRLWARIQYDSSTGLLRFRLSSDGTTWTTVATQAVAWTNRFIPFKAFVGFIPEGGGSVRNIEVSNFEWFDSDGIGRFGNWIAISTASGRFLSMHHNDIAVDIGDYVYAGDLVAYTGNTGFDDTSGRIQQDHLHQEFIPDNEWTYNNDEPINPLRTGLLPRCGTISVAIVRTEENDPLGNLSIKIAITVQRAPCQRFDINRFTVVGTLDTWVLDWDTRLGLNPADNDANNYDGAYFQPLAFDENDTEYTVNYYINKSQYGDFVSGNAEDCDGVVVATIT